MSRQISASANVYVITNEPRIPHATGGATAGARSRGPWGARRARGARGPSRAGRAGPGPGPGPRPRARRVCAAPLLLATLRSHLLFTNHPVERLQRILVHPATIYAPVFNTLPTDNFGL